MVEIHLGAKPFRFIQSFAVVVQGGWTWSPARARRPNRPLPLALRCLCECFSVSQHRAAPFGAAMALADRTISKEKRERPGMMSERAGGIFMDCAAQIAFPCPYGAITCLRTCRRCVAFGTAGEALASARWGNTSANDILVISRTSCLKQTPNVPSQAYGWPKPAQNWAK